MIIQFTHRQRLIMNEKQITVIRKFAVSIKNDI